MAEQVQTVIGRVEVSIGAGTIRFGEATVTEADIEASNGIIHAIDRLLVPEGTNLEDLARGDGR